MERMMPTKRGVPSEVFRSVMENAKKRLLLERDEAGTFEHKGLLGDERAASLAKFFRERIGDRFDVQKGEAIDYRDTRTGQLDFVIYDSPVARPFTWERRIYCCRVRPFIVSSRS